VMDKRETKRDNEKNKEIKSTGLLERNKDEQREREGGMRN